MSVYRGFCRSCSAPVLWTVTVADESMPLDPAPVPDGTIVRVGPETVRELTAGEPWTGPRYVGHVATCEFSSLHRRKPGKERTRDE